MDSDTMFKKIYEADGHDLAYWLNEWCISRTFYATAYGEEVFILDEVDTLWSFRRWDTWRENVAYYYDGILETYQELNLNLGIDGLEALLMFKIATAVHIFDDLDYVFDDLDYSSWAEPAGVDRILLM